MEPNKFERHIKRQMQNREIHPSAKAWKRVSARLAAPDQPKKNHFVWYAAVASFIGLILISALVFESGNNDLDNDLQIVDTEKEELNNIQKNLPSEKENEMEESLHVVKTKIAVIEESSNSEAVGYKKENRQQSFEALNEKTVVVASKETVNDEAKINGLSQDSDERIDLKIAEVLARVDLLEQNDMTVTDAEIDSLLRSAQQELLTDGIFKKDNSVDAMALLTEVEDELNQSFRDQIFEKLKSGFFKIRTAVADRNN